jgi:O-antigen/teichoic acid export membrane protein
VSAVNRASVAAALVQCLPLIALTAAGDITVTNVVVWWTISMTVSPVMLVTALRPIPLRGDLRLAGRQLALGSRYHIGLVAFHLLMTVDVLLLNTLSSAAAVGIYTVAVTLLELARIPAEAITQVALPKQAGGHMRDAALVTARTFRLSALLSAAFVGVLAAAAPLLVPRLYGQSYAGSVAPLLTLAPGMVALFLMRPVEQYLVRLGRPIVMTAVPVGAVLTNVLLNLALIPRWGAVGAAAASTIAYILMATLEVVWFARSAKIPMSALTPRPADVLSALRPLKGPLKRPLKRPLKGSVEFSSTPRRRADS